MSEFKSLIGKVSTGACLTRAEAETAFETIMSGAATPAQIGGFLMALRLRGETIDEIAGAVAVMRAKMLQVEAPDNAIDIVGTGGDGSGSVNISTTTAFVVAASGVPVAKHGNRALSSKSGAADVLTALGVKIDLPPEAISRCIEKAGLGFMFAPAHHSAMKHVGPARTELGIRTIFNVIGPLSNPAGVKRQLLGVYASAWVEPLAQVLSTLGSEKAWVVHGHGGYDELTTAGNNVIAEVSAGSVRSFTLVPLDLNLPVYPIEALAGGDASANALALRGVLGGDVGAYRDTVLLNAAASFVIADKVGSLGDGLALASEMIDSGKALATLETLVAVSNL